MASRPRRQAPGALPLAVLPDQRFERTLLRMQAGAGCTARSTAPITFLLLPCATRGGGGGGGGSAADDEKVRRACISVLMASFDDDLYDLIIGAATAGQEKGDLGRWLPSCRCCALLRGTDVLSVAVLGHADKNPWQVRCMAVGWMGCAGGVLGVWKRLHHMFQM